MTEDSNVEQTIRLDIFDNITDHNYCMVTQKDQIDIDKQYIDNISKLTSNYSSIESFKHPIPKV